MSTRIRQSPRMRLGVQPGEPARRTRMPVRAIAAAGVLAAGIVFWAAYPLSGGQAGTRFSLWIAIVAAVLSIGQLALGSARARPTDGFSPIDHAVDRTSEVIAILPWAELLTVAVLVLEAVHHARPWHTAILGVALLGFLLAVHLGETGSGARALRRQLPLLGIGVGVTALAVGVAALPGLPAGTTATLVRTGAVLVAILVAGLATPVWLGRHH
jgi:hypothetical protein